jgi:hypothetical protein
VQRRKFITLLGGAAAAWPLTARAQGGRTYHIGILHSNPRGSPLVTALFDELRRNGFIEGRNLEHVPPELNLRGFPWGD